MSAAQMEGKNCQKLLFGSDSICINYEVPFQTELSALRQTGEKIANEYMPFFAIFSIAVAGL